MNPHTDIEIKLFHIPTKAELPVGTKVAYKDAFGGYKPTSLGIILRHFILDSTELYDVDGFACTADELRLFN